jgi:hypothetical protein
MKNFKTRAAFIYLFILQLLNCFLKSEGMKNDAETLRDGGRLD